MNMMSYYYGIDYKDEFDNLFKDTYVYKNPTPNKNNYYILRFDFSGISTSNRTIEEIKESFNFKVKMDISIFLTFYGFNTDIDSKSNEPCETLLSLLKYLKRLKDEGKLEHKVYILIDECDNFTNEIINEDITLIKSLVSENNFLKSFISYEQKC